MIYSMTGFAALERETTNGVLIVELRSVNHRYLELQLKLDDSLRGFEPLVRELVTAKLGRGKVECRLSLMQRVDQARQAELDDSVLQQLAKMTAKAQQHFPQSQPLSVADILRWPGVVMSDGTDNAMLADEIREGLTQALQELADSRSREGAKLKILILERLADMEKLVEQVKPLLPLQIKAYQERLTAKLQEAMKSLDEERIRQELIMFAQRIDVDEELTRLTAHLQEVKRILGADSAAGKRLDFLMQELNREANTLGSKSVSTEVSQVSMTLKVLIEQMREQIQNIE
ncbi:MAG TPA: YicC/YloC family endoribonuclease [Methylophilaceae bacterium]|nr:YicC/YloC family endoribonuclease [Methylophilaceae bacterium]